MAMPAIEKRVDRLEDVVQDFVTNVGREFSRLYDSQMRTETEIRALKDEMGDFKDEMGDFKDEMRVFKDESVAFRERMEASHREMNRKWGDLSNKLGTLVEDLVAPSLPRVVQEALGGEVLRLAERVRQKLPDGQTKEYDAIAVTQDLVCVNSTKASLRAEDITRFCDDLGAFRDFFPEYKEYPLIGILATLAADDSLVRYAEKQGFLVLAIGDQIMEIKNHPGFEPKRW